MLQGGGETDHLVEAFRLNPFQLRQILRLMRRNATLDMRFEVIPDLDVAVFAQAAGNAAPHDPEFDPDGLLLVKRHARRELSGSLFATPFIERVAEAWTQRVAGKLTPNALVV